MADAEAFGPQHSAPPDRPANRPSKQVLVGALFFLLGLAAEAVAGELGLPLLLRVLSPAIAVLGITIVTRAGESFHRSGLYDARWKLWTAWAATVALLAIYFGLTIWSSQQDELWLTLFTATCLATAATISLRTVLSPRPPVPVAFVSLSFMLAGIAFLQRGIDESLLAGSLSLLCGVAVLLTGVGFLVGATNSKAVFGAALLLGATAFLAGSVVSFAQGDVLVGAAQIAIVSALLLGGVPPLANRDPLFGWVFPLAAVAIILLATAALRQGSPDPTEEYPLVRVANLMGNVAVLLIGVVSLADSTHDHAWRRFVQFMRSSIRQKPSSQDGK